MAGFRPDAGNEIPRRIFLPSALRHAIEEIESTPGVINAFIVGRDGLLVAGSSAPDRHELRAAMIAAGFGALDRALSSADLGRPSAASIETAENNLQVLAFADFLFVAVVGKGTSLSPVRSKMAQIVSRLVRDLGYA